MREELEVGSIEEPRGHDYASPGTMADHPYAVLYQGPWETLADGTNVAVRRHARALATTGLPVLLRSFTHTVVLDGQAVPAQGNVEAEVKDEVGRLADTSAAMLVPMIKHLVPRDPQHLRSAMFPLMTGLEMEEVKHVHSELAAVTVLYTVWERDRIPADMARVMRRAAQLWVPCRQNADALVASDIPRELVHVVPHPFDPSSRLAVEGPKRGLAGRASRRFYSVGLWQPRKGLHELLGAFLRACPEQDGDCLTIKTTPTDWPGYPTIEQSVFSWLADGRVRDNGWTPEAMRGRVRIVTRRLKRAELEQLHLEHDVYVSASHGEAWALPAYDAKIAGNRLVHVPWGGTADFSDSLDVQVPYEFGPVPASYHWEQGTRWATWTLEALEDALRSASAPSEHSRSTTFDRLFSMEAVGRRMATLLLDVVEHKNPTAWTWLKEQLR